MRPCIPIRRTVGALLLLLLLVAGGCGGSEETTCETSSDCAVAGQLCVEGDCTTCKESASCEADTVYGSQSLTQCREGLCTACAPGLVGCECVAGTCTTGECVGGTCTDCTRGDPDCVCLDNGMCNPGAACTGGLCARCTAGAEACECRSDSSCDAGLTCGSGVCMPEPCPVGDERCACDDGACGSNLYCDAQDACRACSSDVPGCPCNGQDACGGDNFCDEDSSLCAVCSDTDKPQTCGCTATAQCADGLVCDPTEFTCRAPVACDNLSCLPFQLCDDRTTDPSDPTAGDAYCVPETCVPGYIWDATSQSCLAASGTTCRTSAGGLTPQGDACVSQGKTCVDGFAGVACVDTCDTLQCGAENRDCSPSESTTTAVTDAQCSTCQPGFILVGTECVANPTATCETGAATSIAPQCAARFQACEPGTNGGAQCGACLDGRTINPRTGRCEATETCGSHACFGDQFCHYAQDGRRPECRYRCPEGMAMSEAGLCVGCGAVSCGAGRVFGALIDNQCACEEEVFCSDISDSAPRCQVSPCPSGEAVSQLGGSCLSCAAIDCTQIDGVKNRIWPWLTQSQDCICETLDGFYQPDGSIGGATSCDADGDGWINTSANNAYVNAREGVNNSPDQALLSNFRCDRRTVDRIRLVNEFGQRRDIGMCEEGGEIVDWAPGSPPPECGNGPVRIALTEPTTLESDSDISGNPLRFPLLGSRSLRAAELNPLTKACVSRDADFNQNGVLDLDEEQPLTRAALPAQSDDTDLLMRTAAYFTETHQGYYVRTASTGPGIFVVEERSRCDSSFPLRYEEDIGYWRSCTRGRNADYDEAETTDRMTMDFAQFSCDAAAGTCEIPAPRTTGRSIDADEIVDHDVCAFRAAGMLPLADEPWMGMSHHSQFACVEIGTTSATNVVAPDRLTGDPLRKIGTRLDREFDFNSCGACTGANCPESLEVSGSQVPNITCDHVDGASVQLNDVGFVAARYGQLRAEEDYMRGCINEAAFYRDLCPGPTGTDSVVLASGSQGDSGKLVCGCGADYAGRNCEHACAPRPDGTNDKLHYGGPDYGLTTLQQQQFNCIDGGLCLEHEPEGMFTGGRRGFWMCGMPTLTHQVDPTVSGLYQSGTLASSEVVRLRGKVSNVPVVRIPMASSATTAGACSSGNCFFDGGRARVVTAY